MRIAIGEVGSDQARRGRPDLQGSPSLVEKHRGGKLLIEDDAVERLATRGGAAEVRNSLPALASGGASHV